MLVCQRIRLSNSAFLASRAAWAIAYRAAVSSPSPNRNRLLPISISFVEWPKPAYTRFRLGEGRGGGSCRGAQSYFTPRPPPPTPPHKGEGSSNVAAPNAIAPHLREREGLLHQPATIQAIISPRSLIQQRPDGRHEPH